MESASGTMWLIDLDTVRSSDDTGHDQCRLRPVIPIEIRGPTGKSRGISAVIDTGFSGWLFLPYAIIQELELKFAGVRQGTLADNTPVDFDTFLAQAMWHDRLTDVVVLQSENGSMIGMSLLENCHLSMDVIRLGVVKVQQIPTS
jgi:clan AA aspartic protease